MKYILILFLFINILQADGPVEEMYLYDYKPLPQNKAMAIAVNNETGSWAAGMSKGMPSLGSAKNVAMKYCKKYAKEHNVRRPCKIYAINNRVIMSNY